MFLGLGAEWIALVGTIIASVGVAIVNRWLTRHDRDRNDATEIRSELKERATEYKAEIPRLEDELDEWRAKYYAVLEELVAKRIELQNALDQIRRLSSEAERTAEEARKMLNTGRILPPSNS